jgi:hypothetical protein
VPTIVTHGARDRLGRRYKETFDRLEELDLNHISMLMRELGHDLPLVPGVNSKKVRSIK